MEIRVMSKILASCAALAVTALLAWPVPTKAEQPRADGLRNASDIEVSSARRRYRYYPARRYGYYGPRYNYYGPRYGYYGGYYGGPYYAYAPYYRPYRPAPWPFFPFW